VGVRIGYCDASRSGARTNRRVAWCRSTDHPEDARRTTNEPLTRQATNATSRDRRGTAPTPRSTTSPDSSRMIVERRSTGAAPRARAI